MTNEQQKLVEENINLAYFVAHRFKNTNLEFDDVKAIACLGLVKAAIAFQPDRGLVFNTLAVKVITNEILMQLRREKKHNCVTASLDMETVPGEEITLADIIPDTKNDYETFLFWMNVEQNQKLLSGKEKYILQLKMADPDMSQSDIAAKCGYTQPHVSRVLRRIKDKLAV